MCKFKQATTTHMVMTICFLQLFRHKTAPIHSTVHRGEHIYSKYYINNNSCVVTAEQQQQQQQHDNVQNIQLSPLAVCVSLLLSCCVCLHEKCNISKSYSSCIYSYLLCYHIPYLLLHLSLFPVYIILDVAKRPTTFKNKFCGVRFN